MSNPNIATDSPNTFKKGQSGNPKGRPPREWTMTGLIEEALEEQDITGTSYKKTIAKKLITLAAKGDMVAIKEINQRLDGMPKQTTETEVKGTFIINMDELIGLSTTTTQTENSDSETV